MKTYTDMAYLSTLSSSQGDPLTKSQKFRILLVFRELRVTL